MATKYLDSSGLTYFWGKIKAWAKRFLVSSVNYDTTSKKITYTKYDGTNDAEHVIDIVTAATIVTDGGGITDISGKADKVSGATSGNFAGLDSNGNLTDSGHKPSDYLTSHQDISGKADKVSGATAGDVATLDSHGNLVDSGKTLGISVPSDAVFTDTKNTAGASDYSGRLLFIIGSENQSTYETTYTNRGSYIGTDGHIYSNDNQVVNLSDTQSLSNKTYNGLTLTEGSTGFTVAGGTTSKTLTVNDSYTLGAACEKSIDSSITAGSSSTNLPTTAAVESRITSAIQSAQVGAAMFQGTVDSGTTISSLTAYSKGWYWVVGTAGTYVGQVCEVGDMIYCISDYNSAYSASDFSVIQTNLDIESITNSEIDTITSS